MKRVYVFNGFAKERLGWQPNCEESIDACLQAMQEGVLDVCEQNVDGYYLWMCYGMSCDQWQRACSLLQRAGVASSIFWESTRRPLFYHEFMADIDYLWTDLGAVERYLMEVYGKNMYKIIPSRLVKELDRRRWHAGLRRAWLAACTV